MSMRINQNILSIRTHGQLAQTADRLDKSIEKLSSGLRINRASDDAAGLAISEKMRRSIRGLSRAILNAQDGISMIQSAEGALGEGQAIIQRMRELATQSSNDTLTSNDRVEIQKEVVQLRDDLNRIAHNTEFNTKRLLDGSQSGLISATTKYVKGIVTGDVQGGDYNVSLTLIRAGVAEMARSQTLTNVSDGTLAQGNTQLQSIAQFYDANGVFAFETPQQLTLSGNGKTTQITVDRSTNLGTLAGLIASAIQNSSGLDMGASSVDAVTTASTSIAGKGGYLEITSGIIGANGIVNFSGDNALINGLGIQTVRAAINNVVQGTAVDSSGNSNVITTNDERITGILQGIDVKFASQSAQVAGAGGIVEGIRISTDSTFVISANGSQYNFVLSGGSDISGLWTMEGVARAINNTIASAIGNGVPIFNGMAATVVDGQLRISYDPVTAPNTFAIAGFAATGLGLGFTDGQKSGMTTGVKDLNKLVYGFSAYMTAAESVSFSVADAVTSVDILMFTSRTTASVADMIGIDYLKLSANAQLSAATAAIRFDQVGDTFAFTAINVGRTITVSGGTTASQVSINVSSTTTLGDNFVKNNLGIVDKSVFGVGDRNFRMHVVNNNPSFQIGADQGQSMKVGIGSMDATALGLNNINLSSVAGAQDALGKLGKALDVVSSERSKMGAYQNRLEYAINNLRSMHTNIVASESRIRDADIAMEMIEFTRNQIVNQSGTAMLAQANLVPQGVLQLLR